MSEQEKRRSLRKLGRLCRRLGRMVEDGSTSDRKQRRLARRIRDLYASLSHVVPEHALRGIAASLLVLGLASCSGNSGITGPDPTTPAFSPAGHNPFGLAPPTDYSGWLAVADIDGDGDMDIFLGSYSYYDGASIVFFENTGTRSSPAFAPGVENPFGITVSGYDVIPAFGDLDSDGDQDILATVMGDYEPTIQFHENTGSPASPAFAAPATTPFGLTEALFGPNLVDLDGDGDLDIVAGAAYGVAESFVFIENTGSRSSPSFGGMLVNPFGLSNPMDYASFPAVADLDGDGDLDVLSVSYEYYDEGGFTYFQNDGGRRNPAFAAGIRRPFGLPPVDYVQSIALADLDGDGDLDLLASTYGYPGASIDYYENTAR